MPFAFPAVPIPNLATQTPVVEQIDQVLTVEWRKKTVFPAEGKVVFSGGVIARYGPTTVHSDQLTLIQSDLKKEGSAVGNVWIEDPEGDLKATELRFDWIAKLGHAKDVRVTTAGLVLQAAGMEMYPDRYELLGVAASPVAEAPNLVKVRSPKIVFRVGQSGTAYRTSLLLLGAKLVTLPSYRFGAKRESAKLPLPSISWNQGFGISWQTRVGIDDRTSFAGSVRLRSGDLSGATVQATRSLLPRNEPGGIVPALSDQGERFPFGYFDNVGVLRPSMERAALGERRSSLTFTNTLNQKVIGRRTEPIHSKPLDLALEQAGSLGNTAFYTASRYQLVKEEGDPIVPRLQAGVAFLLPEYELARNLRTHARLDGTLFVGEQKFGWGQSQFGLTYHPNQHLRLGAAVLKGFESGTPQFEVDRLFSLGGYLLRLDADLGPTKFSLLSKYDWDLRKWYDNEISVRQAMGSLEPYVTFREFPRTLTFGVRMRLEDVLERLSKRGSKQPAVDRP